MGELRFEWDPAKPAANQRKYGITVAEAETVFSRGGPPRFELNVDQTEVPPLLRQLEDVLSRYPVVGKPAA